MYNFIKNATTEFEQNGRSDAFIAMENKIIKIGKPIQVYFFARYAKGASVNNLQPIIEQKGDLELGYYFCQNVKGAKIRPFAEKAIKENSTFWINKFIEVAKNKSKYIDIADLVLDLPKGMLNSKIYKFDINEIIEDANNEYEQYGRSSDFVELEKCAVHSLISAHSTLFLNHVQGCKIKNFEQAAILRGNPFNMFLIAMCDKSNVDLMIKGLELAKLNYNEIEKELIEKKKRKSALKIAIENSNDSKERSRLISVYNTITDTSDYIAKIDNDYITRINYLLKDRYKK